ncbi:MAG TPA: tripartite tricarboxylate transporter TctB family protein [Steroidobacteraceae bacterium]|nr:tripartite tricarboxylate transporter TctB family protein [Steroidobacteraceae bacterium]
MNSRRIDLALVLGLLAGALLFVFYLVPVGIDEFRAEPGIGFSPRLVPMIAAVILLIALAIGVYDTLRHHVVAASPDNAEQNVGRMVLAATLCFIFSFVGAQVAGFYLGGALLAGLIAWMLGERRPLVLIVFSVALLGTIYAIFELGFQLRFPKNSLIPGLPV